MRKIFTIEEIRAREAIDEDRGGLCSACKEHATAIIFLDQEGEIEEVVSDCCTAGLEGGDL